MKRNSGWMMLAVVTMALAAGCPRDPVCEGPCASGATRCGANGGAQACQAGCWYNTDPVRDGCAPGLACCLTTAPYDAGMIYACASARRCAASADGGVASYADGGAR